MMKKTLALLMTLAVVLLGMSSCSDNDEKDLLSFSFKGGTVKALGPDSLTYDANCNVDITVSNASEAELAIFEVTSGGTTIDMGEHKNLYEGATATVTIKMSSASDKAPTKAQVGSTDIDLTHNTTTDVYTGTFTDENVVAVPFFIGVCNIVNGLFAFVIKLQIYFEDTAITI